jgi:ribosomal protein S18 acetylase RimI-like enzyme
VSKGKEALDPGLEIRSFEERDRAEVVALWNEVFAEDPPRNAPNLVIDRKSQRQAELFLVGILEGAVAATVMGGFDGVRGWAYHLAVRVDARRQAFGALMMARLEAELIDLGCPKLNLQVRTHNKEVCDFYSSLGYQVDDVVSMGKLLIPEE